MKRLTAAVLMMLAATSFWFPADARDATKESPAAQATRKKLKTTISMEMKNEMLREVFKEISGKLQDAKAGALSFTFDTGVSQNSRVTIMAKDKTVADILDEIFKPLDLGYVVVSKPGDRYDGWLLLKKGNLRGDEAGAKETGKEDPKDKKKDKDMKKGEAEPDAEKAAASKLNSAKSYINFKKQDKAKEVLEEILKTYPDTKAAKEAKTLLDKIK